ncbi:MAG: hypothetical protein KME21_30840 [Desmonostoc vinosum HA7617-LM4]|jgi:gas vesicle protein|nr:hypothetical protein [Desmonostoc vinosum HA7617-LM4]
MGDRTFGRNKAATSAFSHPSLVSQTTPTLANPTRGFGLSTNVIETATEESTSLEEAQTAGEESLFSEAVEKRSFGHDISRIALRRPQTKPMVGEPKDKYEQQADSAANQVMRMIVPRKLNALSVQPVHNFLQRKCAACEDEEDKVQTQVSEPAIQRWSLFGDDEDKQESESSSGGGVLDWVKEKGSAAVDTVTQTGSDVYDLAKEKGSAAVDTVTQTGSDVYDWAKEKGGAAVDTVTQTGSDVYDLAKEKGGAAVDSVTNSGGQAANLISNWRNIQVNWNSESGKILQSWASQLDPEIVIDISGKSPAELYKVVDVPDQIKQAAKELAKQVKTDVTPGFAPSPNIPLPDIDIPGIPGRKPAPGPAPKPPAEPRPAPDSPTDPTPMIILLLLIGIIIFLAILYYGRKKKSQEAPGSGYQGGGGTSGGGGSTDSWDDEKIPEDEKKGGCSQEKFDREYLTAKDLISESEGYKNKYGAGEGHLVKEHVGKSNTELCERACNSNPNRKATTASTFKDRPEADASVQNILNSKNGNIKQWATDPAREIGDERSFSVQQTNVGTTAACVDKTKKSCNFAPGKGVTILLIFDPTWKVKRGCFWLLTGHPTK